MPSGYPAIGNREAEAGSGLTVIGSTDKRVTSEELRVMNLILD